MMHRVVKVSKVRCEVLPTGPRFKSIGQTTFITIADNDELSSWWLNKISEWPIVTRIKNYMMSPMTAHISMCTWCSCN